MAKKAATKRITPNVDPIDILDAILARVEDRPTVELDENTPPEFIRALDCIAGLLRQSEALGDNRTINAVGGTLISVGAAILATFNGPQIASMVSPKYVLDGIQHEFDYAERDAHSAAA